MASRIRVLIVDDHTMVRRGMRDFLDLHDERTHVSNILAKLGLTSRTQAALFAVEHRLGAGS